MAESYLEITIGVPVERAGELAERLHGLAPSGLAIEEPYVPLGPDEGVRLEPWRPALLRLYLPVDELLAERRGQVTAAIAALPFEPAIEERELQAEDWAHAWKQFFQIEHAGHRIVIRPSWRDYSPRPGEVVIELDPGMAFGTGQHQTTRLCLEAIEELLPCEAEVLDLGCGSGILALAAAKLGARAVIALDVEPLAVEATRSNARRNGVEHVLRAERGSLGDAWPLSEPQAERFDLILANINAATISALAPALVDALRPGGRLLASGIIAERLDEPLLALAAAGLRVERLIANGDWRGIVAARRDAEADR